MNSKIIEILFEIGGAVAQQIYDAVNRGDVEELRRLAATWPEPIRLKLVLLEAEAMARRAATKSTS